MVKYYLYTGYVDVKMTKISKLVANKCLQKFKGVKMVQYLYVPHRYNLQKIIVLLR